MPQRPLSVALRRMGWIEGENLTIERRYAEFKHERLAGFAEELVRKRVDLILAGGPAATVAVARATRTIPVVFAGAVSPVELGLIDSFARPGRNLTGFAYSSGVEVSTKRLQFLREVAPEARRLSWVVSGSPLIFSSPRRPLLRSDSRDGFRERCQAGRDRLLTFDCLICLIPWGYR